MIAVGFRNGIGNFVLLLPCLKALSIYYDSQIDLVIDKQWESKDSIVEIAQNIDFIREIIHYEEYVQRSYEINYMSLHNNIDCIFSAFNSEKEIPFNRISHWVEGDILHEIEFYIDEIEKEFNIQLPILEQFFPIKDFPDNIFPNGIDGLISICNGYLKTPSDDWIRKSYPHWNKVIETIQEIYDGYEICLIGGEDDKKWSEPLAKEYNVVDTCGKLSILQTAGLIQASDAILTTDTSCMHIADALKTYGIALFGPTLVSKNGPLNNTIIPIRSPIDCAPCQGTIRAVQCEDCSICMDAIDPRIIISALKTILD